MPKARHRKLRASMLKALWRARRLRRTVAKAKAGRSGGSRRKKPRMTASRSVRSGFLKSSLFRKLVFLVLILLALSLLFTPLLTRAFDTRDALVEAFGMGLVPLVVGIGIGIWGLWSRPQNVVKRWNKWVGGALFLTAVLGGLSFFRAEEGVLESVTYGGTVGLSIIDSQSFLGILRILAILFLGFSFMAPRRAWRLARTFAKRVVIITPRAVRLFSKSLQALGRGLWVAGRYVSNLSKRGIDAWRRRARAKAVPQAPPSEPPQAPVEEMPGATQGPPKLQEAIGALRRKLGAPSTVPETARWKLPSMDIMDKASNGQASADTIVDNEGRAKAIEKALISYGVEAKVVQINPGPAVTQFGVEPGWARKYKEVRERDARGKLVIRRREISKTRVKVDTIIALEKDLTLALAAPSIRIEAPVPGKPLIGLEVPNRTLGVVGLRSVLESTAYQRLKSRTKLAVALGKGSAGEAAVADLARMPHLLIAGATGSGKSVCISSIISTLLMNATPDDVRFLMVDPKRVELINFNSIPHLLTPVIVDSERVMGVLRWVNHEMNSRYKKFAASGAKNIEAFNRNKKGEETMPYIVLFIDELADLMMATPYEVEHDLCRLAQLGRATGIHLVVATQRPSVDVVTGLIKANFPTRISFAVSSFVDSRVILDTGGADKLLGRGDMLFLPQDAPKPKRLQGTYVSESETERLVNFWNSQKKPEPFYTVSEELAAFKFGEGEQGGEDVLLQKAKELALEHRQISASLLQRRLRIGYPRAARLVDLLEQEGVVGPGEMGKSREVIVDSLVEKREIDEHKNEDNKGSAG
ncbi:MAG: DNA translocase FtsK [Chloroflexi bacterium]|nr:DNA translocase FtsK [Chloroflexota bacterium]